MSFRKLHLIVGLVFALLGKVFFCEGKKLLLSIDTDAPIHVLHPLSPSVAMGAVVLELHWVDRLADEKMMALAKGLAPSYLRVGGTKADFLHYIPDEVDFQWQSENFSQSHSSSQCRPEVRNATAFESFRTWAIEQVLTFKRNKKKYGIRNVLKPINVTGSSWRKLNEFCDCVGWKLVFGLNLLTRNGTEWDSSNTELLLNFTKNRYHVDWELGNEPNSYAHKTGVQLTPEQVGNAFLKLKTILKKSSWWDSSLLLGPDANRIPSKHAGPFISSFLNVAGSVINGLTFHQYYMSGRTATEKDFLDPKVLNSLIESLVKIKQVANTSTGGQVLWLDETASASGGGAPGLSDRFIDGFMWLDKLGLTSSYGIDMVVRQSFSSANYDLVDTNFDPLPDYWLTYIYKKLVGNKVLKVKLENCGRSQCQTTINHGKVRVYAHCAKQTSPNYKEGAVVIYFINLRMRTIRLKMQPFHEVTLKLDVYLLQPSTPGQLASNGTLLNGKLLQLSDDNTFPSILPKRLSPRSGRKGIRIPSRTFGFVVLSNAMAEACMHK